MTVYFNPHVDNNPQAWIINEQEDGTFLVCGNLYKNKQFKYPFQTKEWATDFLYFCLRMESIIIPPLNKKFYFINSSSALGCNTTSALSFTSQLIFNNVTIFCADSKGNVLILNLPEIIMTWFKLTNFYKFFFTKIPNFLKKLWLGENKYKP